MTNDSFEYYYCFDVDSFLINLNKCRRNNKFTDVIIKVSNQQFPVHRNVLASWNLTEVSFDDSTQTVLELDEEYVKVEIIEDLLTYLYTQKITLKVNTVHLILIAASHLKILPLIVACEGFFIDIFDQGDIFDWFWLSIIYELERLKNHCLDFMIRNIKKVFDKRKVSEFSFEDFQILLHEINKRTDNETVQNAMIEFVIDWVAHDQNRSSFLSKLLRKISLSEKRLRKLFLHPTFDKLILNECSRFLMICLKKILNCTELFYYGGLKNFDNFLTSSLLKFTLDLDSSNNKFMERISLRVLKPIEKANQCGVYMNNNIYLLGGHINEGILAGRYVTNSGVWYNCLDQRWRRLPPLPHMISNGAAAAGDGFVYVTGGLQNEHNSGPKDCSAAVRFNVQTRKWTKLKSMNYARYNHQLVVLNDHLYAIAGYCSRSTKNIRSTSNIYTNIRKFSQNIFSISSGNYYEIRKEVERYNPMTNEWTTVSSCHYEHIQNDNIMSATVHLGKIYVCSDSGFEVYWPELDKWKLLLRLEKSITGLSLLSMKGQLIAFSDKSGILYCYDIYDNRWSYQAKMEVNALLYENLDEICPVVVQW